MRRLSFVAPLVIAVAATGCSQFTVRSRTDPSQDWSTVRTFAWLPKSEAAPADQVTQDRAVDKRIRADVEREMAAKGYALAADPSSADVLVNWRITSKPASDARADPVAAWGSWWSGWNNAYAVYSDDFDTGALFIAIVDPKRRQMIWVGAAEARLLPHVSLDRRLGRVDDAVKATMKTLPAR